MATPRLLAVFSALALVVAPATFGCASASPETAMRTKSTSSAVLTGDEIRRNRIDNAYDAVRRLRPAFLSTRGPTSVINAPRRHDIIVIVNGMPYGGVEDLRSLRAVEIAWVRRLTAAEAYIMSGRPAPAGGIELRLEPCPAGCR